MGQQVHAGDLGGPGFGEHMGHLAPAVHLHLGTLPGVADHQAIAGGGFLERQQTGHGRLTTTTVTHREVQHAVVQVAQAGLHRLAAELERTVVLRGDSTDEALLDAESIEETDMFLALTNDEEDNIMSASLAKQMGARRTLALINRKSYVDLVQGGRIDIAISPAQTSIGQLLARVRRGDVAAVHSLRRGAAEALELVAHGDAKHCKVIGRRLEELDLPEGATIAAIVRQTGTSRTEYRDLVPYEVPIVEVIMAHHDTVIRPDDHVIVFCTSKKLVARVEKLFQVGWGFF